MSPYSNVNPCLNEARRALAIWLAGIEGGIECAKLAPLLSALVDGEARAQDLALLRPHMKTFLACRARLREFREAPARILGDAPANVTRRTANRPPARWLPENRGLVVTPVTRRV